MSSELELGFWALVLFGLFAASIVYVCWDSLRERERQKRYAVDIERYAAYMERKVDHTLTRINTAWDRQTMIELRVKEMLSGECWAEREEELTKQLDEERETRKKRYKPRDYYRYNQED